MRAIKVKFHGPTNTRGSRYTADDGEGNRATVSSNHALHFTERADQAVLALCKKMNWAGTLVRGEVKNEAVYVFESSYNKLTVGEEVAK